jgi:hypothetical protein
MSFESKQAYREDLFQRAVPELSGWEPFKTEDVAPRLWDEVKEDVANDVDFADEVMDDIGHEGARKVLADAKRIAAKASVLVRHNGHQEKRESPGYRGTERVDPAGESYFQQSIWWEMDYDAFAALFQVVLRTFRRSAEQLAAFQQVMDAYTDHREASNAAEACHLAGINPREIEITDADVRRARGA